MVATEDLKTCTNIVAIARNKNPQWAPVGCGVAYDGRSSLFTSLPLKFTDVNDAGKPCATSEVGITPDGSERETKTKYRVTLTLIDDKLITPGNSIEEWQSVKPGVLRALDISLFSEGRWGIVKDNPRWFIVGSKMYSAKGPSHPLTPGYEAMKGYYAGLKVCKSGLVLVADMSVGCFLSGGPMIDVMFQAGQFPSKESMVNCCRQGSMNRNALRDIEEVIKGTRCKVLHLGHSKKIKGLGPAANNNESKFEHEGVMTTVEDYFSHMCKVNTKYAEKLPEGRLKYPDLPTVNVGSKNHPILVPPELVFMHVGQCRNKKVSPAMTASLISVVRKAEEFGMKGVSHKPLAIEGCILPNAKIQYHKDVVDPMLTGEWNMARHHEFSQPPPAPTGNGYIFGVVLVKGNNSSDNDALDAVRNCKSFFSQMEEEAHRIGMLFFFL